MHMREGRGRIGMVAGLVCVVVLGSTGLAAAQRRNADRPWVIAPRDVAGGSRVGLSIEEVADNDAADEGAFVRDVRAGSPAEVAGFAEGDIVVEFDGERVRSARQLTRLVQETPAGRTVGTAVLRDGRRVEMEVTPEPSATAALPTLDNLGGLVSRFVPDTVRDFTYGLYAWPGQARLGARVQELSPQLAEYFSVDDGVLVSSVDAESVAAAAGLQAGDVITAVDGRPVEDTAPLRRRLSAIGPGEEVLLGVTRMGSELELTATMKDGRVRPRELQIFRRDGGAI